MVSAEIALECGLKVRVDCQDRLCVNSDADETIAIADMWGSAASQQWKKFKFLNLLYNLCAILLCNCTLYDLFKRIVL